MRRGRAVAVWIFGLAGLAGLAMVLAAWLQWRAGFDSGATIVRFDGPPARFLVWPKRNRIEVWFSAAPGDRAVYECRANATQPEGFAPCPAINWTRLRERTPDTVRVIAMDGWIVGLKTDGVGVLEPEGAWRAWRDRVRNAALFGGAMIITSVSWFGLRFGRRRRAGGRTLPRRAAAGHPEP